MLKRAVALDGNMGADDAPAPENRVIEIILRRDVLDLATQVRWALPADRPVMSDVWFNNTRYRRTDVRTVDGAEVYVADDPPTSLTLVSTGQLPATIPGITPIPWTIHQNPIAVTAGGSAGGWDFNWTVVSTGGNYLGKGVKG